MSSVGWTRSKSATSHSRKLQRLVAAELKSYRAQSRSNRAYRVSESSQKRVRRDSTKQFEFFWREVDNAERNSDPDFEEKLGYFRYVDTKIRRLESPDGRGSRTALSGVRRALKDILFRVGKDGFIFPFIADDGEGGVFAEWRAGQERIEIALEDETDAYIRVSYFGDATIDEEFDPSIGPSPELLDRLQTYLAAHTVAVVEKNPDWRRYFVAR